MHFTNSYMLILGWLKCFQWAVFWREDVCLNFSSVKNSCHTNDSVQSGCHDSSCQNNWEAGECKAYLFKCEVCSFFFFRNFFIQTIQNWSINWEQEIIIFLISTMEVTATWLNKWVVKVSSAFLSQSQGWNYISGLVMKRPC